MNKLSRVSIGLLGLLFIAPFSYAKESCDIQEVQKNVLERLKTITSYQFEARTTMDGDYLASMKMYGKRPDLLKVIMTTDDEQKPITVIFNKKYQWIDDSEAAYRIDLDKINRNTEHPFNTPYTMSGNGLLNGEDYVTTIKALFLIYDFSVSCQQDKLRFTGKLNKTNFSNYVKTKELIKPLDAFVDQFAKTLGKATIKVDKHSYLVSSYSLTGVDKSADFKAVFSRYDFAEIMDDFFDYQPPSGMRVIDITPKAEDIEGTDSL